MKLNLQRNQITEQAVIGSLTLNGSDECFTLERPDVIIPPGTYSIRLYNSPDHGYTCPLLEDVPGRNYIEIHIGNFPRDTKGCILVGQEKGQNVLLRSKLAFEQLMDKLWLAWNSNEEITIEIY